MLQDGMLIIAAKARRKRTRLTGQLRKLAWHELQAWESLPAAVRA